MDYGLTTYSRFDTIKKWLFSVILIPICLYFLLNRGEYTLLDSADLIIHEAGHFIFMVFGTSIHVFGGTLMQILLPAYIVYFFAVNDFRIGVQIFLFWLGHNFINISVYAADARAQILPLLGGEKVIHDWHYMLTGLNLLPFAEEVGLFFFGLAIITFILTLITPFFYDN
ncbi:MAG TPA: hypothetical protein VFF33_06860 [Ignavibacteriaceae bacterium]|nr:hypothetical protein [Ignavibacteriaceae bacterium]